MKAMAFTKHGGPEVIKEVEVDLPKVNSNEVKLDVKAFALNYLDIWVRRGRPNSTKHAHHQCTETF